jgi:hypothetical protein
MKYITIHSIVLETLSFYLLNPTLNSDANYTEGIV